MGVEMMAAVVSEGRGVRAPTVASAWSPKAVSPALLYVCN